MLLLMEGRRQPAVNSMGLGWIELMRAERASTLVLILVKHRSRGLEGDVDVDVDVVPLRGGHQHQHQHISINGNRGYSGYSGSIS